MKNILLVIVLLGSFKMVACQCLSTGLMNQLGQATFAAKVKILKISPSDDANYLDADIKILEVYKGEEKSTIKIHNPLYSTCQLSPATGQVWLILTPIFEGIASASYCSGSMQLDRNFVLYKHESPTAENNYKQEIDRKLKILNYLKDHSIPVTNNFDMSINFGCNLAGFANSNEFAIYRFIINPDLSVKEMINLKSFSNSDLSEAISKCNNIQINVGLFHKGKKIPNEQEVIIVMHYYPGDEKTRGFLSTR